MKALVLAVLLGCGPAHQPPPTTGSQHASPQPADAAPVAVVDAGSLDQDLPRLATRSLGLLETLVERFTIAGENCGDAVRQLDELSGTYADVIAANSKVFLDGREMQLKLALRRYDDRFQEAARAIMKSRTVAACARDDAFAKAFDKLAGNR